MCYYLSLDQGLQFCYITALRLADIVPLEVVNTATAASTAAAVGAAAFAGLFIFGRIGW